MQQELLILDRQTMTTKKFTNLSTQQLWILWKISGKYNFKSSAFKTKKCKIKRGRRLAHLKVFLQIGSNFFQKSFWQMNKKRCIFRIIFQPAAHTSAISGFHDFKINFFIKKFHWQILYTSKIRKLLWQFVELITVFVARRMLQKIKQNTRTVQAWLFKVQNI